MNIYDYFKQELGRAPDDVTLKELPVESTCGDDCVKAIDAAKAFAHYCRMARGEDAGVVDMCDDIVQVFWRG